MKFTDKSFRKVFILLVTLLFTLSFVLALHLILLIPINSKSLWVGSGIMLIGTNILYDLRSIAGKMITLIVMTISMTGFFIYMLHWSLSASIYTSSIGVGLVVLLYMTFIS